MLVAELTFTLRSGRIAEAEDAVSGLLAVWYKNGQLEAHWQLVEAPNALVAYVRLPEEHSLDASHANQYVRAALLGLEAASVSGPAVRVLGDEVEQDRACACVTASSFILFTHLFASTSPVRCGTCFMPVPLYRLPCTRDTEHLDILQWAADYRACDTLQMHCTTGERFGERQLGRHDSSLSRQGRALAAGLAAALGVPVYYNLFRARGRARRTELARRCPSCGRDWRLDVRWHDLFDFRCDACQLVSGVACSLSG